MAVLYVTPMAASSLSIFPGHRNRLARFRGLKPDCGALLGLGISGSRLFGTGFGTLHQLRRAWRQADFPHRRELGWTNHITGAWTDSGGASHGFLRDTNGTITTFNAPGGVTISPGDINTSGPIAGVSSNSAGVLSGLIRSSRGTYATFSPPAGTITAWVIRNDVEQAAGSYAGSDYTYHGFFQDPTERSRRSTCRGGKLM
jgi:hypothetical protein